MLIAPIPLLVASSLLAHCAGFQLNRAKISHSLARYWSRPSWTDLIAAKNKLIATQEVLIATMDGTIKSIEEANSGLIAMKDKTIKKMEEALTNKDRQLAELVEAYDARAFQLQRDLDASRGDVDTRDLLEASIKEINEAASVEQIPTTGIMDVYIDCPGLSAYLNVAATDNHEDSSHVLLEASKYISQYFHSLHPQGRNASSAPPTAMFDMTERSTRIAVAALLRFSGRNIALYDYMGTQNSRRDPILLRPVPHSRCASTAAEITLQPPTRI